MVNLLSIEKSITVITFVRSVDLLPFSSSIYTSSRRLDIARNTEQRREINSRGQRKIILLLVETWCIRAGCSLTEHYVTYPVASRVDVPGKWLIKHCFNTVSDPFSSSFIEKVTDHRVTRCNLERQHFVKLFCQNSMQKKRFLKLVDCVETEEEFKTRSRVWLFYSVLWYKSSF